VRERDVDDLMTDVQQLARRQPMAFVGGAFFLGLMVARFLKSSRHEEEMDYRGYYGGRSSTAMQPYRGYGRGYGYGSRGSYDYGYGGRGAYGAGYGGRTGYTQNRPGYAGTYGSPAPQYPRYNEHSYTGAGGYAGAGTTHDDMNRVGTAHTGTGGMSSGAGTSGSTAGQTMPSRQPTTGSSGLTSGQGSTGSGTGSTGTTSGWGAGTSGSSGTGGTTSPSTTPRQTTTGQQSGQSGSPTSTPRTEE
jgi:hypothetical protein